MAVAVLFRLVIILLHRHLRGVHHVTFYGCMFKSQAKTTVLLSRSHLSFSLDRFISVKPLELPMLRGSNGDTKFWPNCWILCLGCRLGFGLEFRDRVSMFYCQSWCPFLSTHRCGATRTRFRLGTSSLGYIRTHLSTRPLLLHCHPRSTGQVCRATFLVLCAASE